MEIGVRLRQTRLELGMSQRELCGDVITRNMLSLIENGSARPSMDTLIYLAGRLNRPVAYFLEEPTASANELYMEKAREAYAQRDFAAAEAALAKYQGPDRVFDEERGLLQVLVLLSRAEECLDRPGYALELLNRASEQRSIYLTEELERRRLLLLAQVSREPVTLPVDDRPLLIRAEAALRAEDAKRCIVLLEACQKQSAEKWRYLRGEAAFALGDYEKAVESYPENCFRELEACYRNLGDYKMAYEYACKQRQSSSNFPKEGV